MSTQRLFDKFPILPDIELKQDCSYWSSWSGSVNNSWLVYIAFANSLLAVKF